MRRLSLFAVLFLAACSSDPEDPAVTPSDFVLMVQEVATGLSNPTYVTSPPGDTRLFVVEQSGRIRIIENGQLLATPFLDITGRVLSGGERGLLSLAFHPGYKTNGFFYVYFTVANGDIHVERFTVSANPDVANPVSSKLILTAPHFTAPNHNGG